MEDTWELFRYERNQHPAAIFAKAFVAKARRRMLNDICDFLPGMEFRPNWHIEAMAYKLSQVANGEIKRLIITLPPRNLKSICASVALPAWFLGHNPSERVVAVSYSAELAKTHANDFRLVVNDPANHS